MCVLDRALMLLAILQMTKVRLKESYEVVRPMLLSSSAQGGVAHPVGVLTQLRRLRVPGFAAF